MVKEGCCQCNNKLLTGFFGEKKFSLLEKLRTGFNFPRRYVLVLTAPQNYFLFLTFPGFHSLANTRRSFDAAANKRERCPLFWTKVTSKNSLPKLAALFSGARGKQPRAKELEGNSNRSSGHTGRMRVCGFSRASAFNRWLRSVVIIFGDVCVHSDFICTQFCMYFLYFQHFDVVGCVVFTLRRPNETLSEAAAFVISG